jgi:hypothetical protein
MVDGHRSVEISKKSCRTTLPGQPLPGGDELCNRFVGLETSAARDPSRKLPVSPRERENLSILPPSRRRTQ